jgi:hypothetical protein
MIERMKMMKETLMNCVQGQLGDLSSVDAKELGEAVDMIKDFSEAIYYCTITESMEKTDKEKEKYYPMDYNRYYRDMDKPNGYMYYTDTHGVSHPSANMTTGAQGTHNYPIEIRDYREGRSPMTRKTYMERKMHGGGKEAQMHELEKYMQELTSDITEMIEGASVEEKQMLKTKISALATKIV